MCHKSLKSDLNIYLLVVEIKTITFIVTLVCKPFVLTLAFFKVKYCNVFFHDLLIKQNLYLLYHHISIILLTENQLVLSTKKKGLETTQP